MKRSLKKKSLFSILSVFALAFKKNQKLKDIRNQIIMRSLSSFSKEAIAIKERVLKTRNFKNTENVFWTKRGL